MTVAVSNSSTKLTNQKGDRLITVSQSIVIELRCCEKQK